MRIGLDLDDVLAQSLPKLVEAFERRFGIPVKLKEAAWNLATRYPEVPLEAYTTFLKELDQQGFFEQVVLDMEAKAAVEQLHALGHRLYIVTGRPPIREGVTLHWLDEQGLLRYFEAVFHKDGERVSEYKKRIANKLGLEVFLEDELHVALALADPSLLSVFLFDRPWNQGFLPPGVQRIHSWQEALQRINGLDGR